MRGGWVYIITNRPFGSLYVGVANDIARRSWEHRTAVGGGFTSRYRLRMPVYAEWHEDIAGAIQRETRIKHRPRRWQLNLVNLAHPHPFASSRTRGSSTVYSRSTTRLIVTNSSTIIIR
jgi:putative endonuclease